MAYKVITAAADEPVSIAEARLQVKAGSDTSEDELIATWITAAREIAEHYTGVALAVQTLEMALRTFPGVSVWRLGSACPDPLDDVIRLDMPPVTSVTSIKYTDSDGAEQTMGTSAYALSTYGESNTVAPTYGNYWPSAQNIPDAVRIRYVTGYAVCPSAARAAILLMVAWFNEHRGETMDPDDIQPPAAKSLLNTVKSWAR